MTGRPASTGADTAGPAAAGRGHGSRFLRGAAWSVLNAGAGVVLPFLIFVLFARWLEPGQVGAAVLAAAIVEIIKPFGAPGLYEALLQEGCDTRRHHETAAAVLLASGVALTLVFLGVYAAWRQWMPEMAAFGWLPALVGLRIVFDLATLQPLAALAKRLAFGRMASRSIVANVGAGVIGLGLAADGYAFEGLIAYLVAQSVLVLAATIVGSSTLAFPRIDRAALADLRAEALSASAVRLVAAVNNSLDQVLVAGFIGSARLAFFNLGKRIETAFITTASSFSMILFQPLFSAAPEARANGMRHGLLMLTVVCGLPAAFMLANAEAVTDLVFGPRWHDAAAVAAILALSGFVRALGGVHGAMLSVTRRNRPLMQVTAVSAISGIAIVIAAQGFGLEILAAGLAAKNLAMVAWMAWLTRGECPRTVTAYLGAVVLPFAAMTGLALLPHVLSPGLDRWTSLILSGLGAGLAALVCIAPQLGLTRRWRRLVPAAATLTPKLSSETS